MCGAFGRERPMRRRKRPDPAKMDDSDFRRHIDDLKAAVPGRTIATGFGLRGHGRRFFCPKCQPEGGKTPDLDVFDKGFRCYKCGLTGDVIDLVALASGMSRGDAIRWMENRSGIHRPGRPTRTSDQRPIVDSGPSVKAARPVQRMPVTKQMAEAATDRCYDAFLREWCGHLEGTAGAEYLLRRGIDPVVADDSGIRFLSDPGPYYRSLDPDRVKAAGLSSIYVFVKQRLSALVFPYLSGGRSVFLKFRSLLSKTEADQLQIPRFVNTSGVVPCLWNHDAIREADRVLICEGEIDALSAICAGHPAVAVPGAKNWKDSWVADFDGKDVVLVMDADAAGREGGRTISSSFLRAGRPAPRQLVLPAGMDLNDFLRNEIKE